MLIDPALLVIANAIRAHLPTAGPLAGSSTAGSSTAVSIDWSRVGQLLARHRVSALAAHGLRRHPDLPPTFAAALTTAEYSAVVASQRAIAVSAQLLKRFAEADIDLLLVKGATLAALAYPPGTPRHSLDIDVLIGPNSLDRAVACLGALGYRPLVPADPARLARWHRVHKESQWIDDHGQLLDLHTRLVDDPALLRQVGLGSARQWVAVGGGVELPTLADDELYAYLAVHGATSGWFRLKWLADFAALLASSSPQDIGRRHDVAVRVGAGRASAVGLLLAQRLFALPLDPMLTARLRADRALRPLIALCLNELCCPLEPTERRLGTMRMRIAQARLRHGGAGMIANLLIQSRAVAMRG